MQYKGGIYNMYTLKELCNKAFNELLDSGLSYKTVYGSNWYIWNRLVRKYGENEIFNENMVYEYCYEYFGKDIYSIDNTKLMPCESMYIKAFHNFILSSNNVPFKKITFHFKRNYVLNENSSQQLNKYIAFCESKGNGRKTLENKHNRIKNFIIDSDFETITRASFISYLNKRKTDMNMTSYVIEIGLIRLFLVFCYENGKLDKEILLACPTNMCSIKDKYVPSTYSINEIKQLLNSAKVYQNEDNHLRNYAILSLIAYSGIRSNDVTNLKLSNINWRANEINFIQEKTKKKSHDSTY